MTFRIAVLDDYQSVALEMAEWEFGGRAEVTVFTRPFADAAEARAALAPFHVLCLLRERTPVPATLIDALPELRLIVTAGSQNAAVDVAAAAARGVPVCGTDMAGHPTAELVFAHLLEFMRGVGRDNARLHAAAAWQDRVGGDLSGRCLGVIGLGRLGRRVATIADAFGMDVLAWSRNLTPEDCAETPAVYAPRDELLARADVVSLHLRLSERTRGLIGERELGLMQPHALLINTSRGPIVDEPALVAALEARRIGGAALDVFDTEPLPPDHPFRRLDNAQITPHLGYVTEANYRQCYGQMVEDIRTWLDGAPIRSIAS